jgi:hypothetical protein
VATFGDDLEPTVSGRPAGTEAASRKSEIATAEEEATRAAGIDWQLIPQRAELPHVPDVSGVYPPPPYIAGQRSEEIAELAQALRDAAADLLAQSGELADLASLLGLQTPVTFAAADDIISVALRAEAPHMPERLWLSPAGHASAVSAAEVLETFSRLLLAAEGAASAYYTAAVLEEKELPALAERSAPGGFVGGGMVGSVIVKLTGQYRADKKTIAAFTRSGVSACAARENLTLAVAWQQATTAFMEASAKHGPALGERFAGRATDFFTVRAGLEVAAAVLRLVRGQDTAGVADYLLGADADGDGEPDAGGGDVGDADAGPRRATILDLAHGIGKRLQDWRDAAAIPPELLAGTFDGAAEWLRAQAGFLKAASAVTSAVSVVVGKPLTAGNVRYLLRLRTRIDAAREGADA